MKKKDFLIIIAIIIKILLIIPLTNAHMIKQEDSNSSYFLNLTTNGGHIEENYTVPVGANVELTIIQLSHGNRSTYNASIPTNCADSTTIRLRMSSYQGATVNSTPQCWNGTTWEIFGNPNPSIPHSGGSSAAAGPQEATDGVITTGAFYNAADWRKNGNGNRVIATINETAVFWDFTDSLPTGSIPIIESVRIQPTPIANLSNDLYGFCNASDDGYYVNYNWSFYNNNELFSSGTTINNPFSSIYSWYLMNSNVSIDTGEENNILSQNSDAGVTINQTFFYEGDGSARFNGSDGSCSNTNPPHSTGNFLYNIGFDVVRTSGYTFDFWARIDNLTKKQYFLSLRGTGNGFSINKEVNGEIIFQHFDNIINSSSVINITTNDWHHYAVRKNASSCELWIDGVSVGVNNVCTGGEGSAPLRIGASRNNCETLEGQIDNVRYWSSPLSDNEISFLINNLTDYYQVQGVEVNLENISSADTSIGEEWIFSCAAIDLSGNFSNFTNSSITTILNLLNITVRSAQTNNIIQQNISLRKTTSTKIEEFTITNGSILINLTDENNQLDFNITGYSDRRYYFDTSTETEPYLLTAYLSNENLTHPVTFIVRNNENELVEGVLLTFTRLLGDEYITEAERITDISGSVTVELDGDNQYTIIVEAEGYVTRNIVLEPTGNSYTIYLTSAVVEDFDNVLNLFSYVTLPLSGLLTANITVFNISVNSPGGVLGFYGMRTRFNGTTYLTNITTEPNGGITSFTINLTGQEGKSININYFVKVNSYETYNFNRTFFVSNASLYNTSILGILDTSGDNFGIFTKILLAVGMTIFIVIIFAPFVPKTALGIIAGISLIIFTIIGWIPAAFTIAGVIITIGLWIFLSKTGGHV